MEEDRSGKKGRRGGGIKGSILGAGGG